MSDIFKRCIVALVLAWSLPVQADQLAQAQSARELRASLEDAKRQATSSEGLDAAYELAGIAEAAQSSNAPDIAKEAVTALNNVLERATQAALVAPFEDAQDTLDQLVDLSFYTRTSKVSGADAVLEKSQRALLPKIANDARNSLVAGASNPEQWGKQIISLSVLGELQAAATLTMLDDIAGRIAQMYEDEAKRLLGLAQQIPNATERDKVVADLAAGEKIRGEQVRDAAANNLAKVAAEMSKPGRPAAKDEESAEVSADMSDVSQACLETAVIAPPSMTSNWDGLQEILPKLEEQCVLSGRTATENRCTLRNLSFICREAPNDKTETMTYVYVGTAEDKTMRTTCKGQTFSASMLGNVYPAFANVAMRRIMTCAPVPFERAPK